MNLAIVIGISEYSDSQNNLPGCTKDAEVIYNILLKTSKFDNILYVNEKMASAKVKEKMIEFISGHKEDDIEELFFYFTGHGEFKDDEFYYLLHDFIPSKRKQTSLQNDEVDTWFKTLNPNLIIKVIDACQSGKNYIKEAGILKKHFNETINRYNKCYFLSSSLNTQGSFQTDSISDFTYAFVKSIQEHEAKDIRYKDIMDFISDEFEKNSDQTPFFVIQADLTEKFCAYNSSLTEYLKSVDITGEDLSETEKKLTLIEKIQKQAGEYFSREKTMEFLQDLRVELEKIELPKDLQDIFSIDIQFVSTYDAIEKKSVIGKWLDNNQNDFFAKSVRSSMRKDRHSNPYSSFASLGSSWSNILAPKIYNPEEHEWVTTGFDLEIEVPYKAIIFNLESKYPNVDSYTLRMIFLVSQRIIRFFFFVTNFEVKNWDEKKINSKIQWSTFEDLIIEKEKVLENINKAFSSLIDRVKSDLEEKFNNQEL